MENFFLKKTFLLLKQEKVMKNVSKDVKKDGR